MADVKPAQAFSYDTDSAMCQVEKSVSSSTEDNETTKEVNDVDDEALPPTRATDASDVATTLLPREQPPDYIEIDLPVKDNVDGREVETDHWDLPDLADDDETDGATTSSCGRLASVGRVLLLPCLLFLFICSLDLLSSGFRLVGGKAAGGVFQDSALLQNPVAGLMIGILSTVLVQSSSTSTSIVVTMVASGIIGVKPAIPIIMGSNIGTSVTNTIVSMAQSGDRNEFRRAFGGATVHDMFNWLAVLVLLPLEVATGYLYILTQKMVAIYNLDSKHGKSPDMLKTLTKPVTSLIIKLDKNVIEKIATGDAEYADHSMIKRWCTFSEEQIVMNTSLINSTLSENSTHLMNKTVKTPVEKCAFLFNVLPQLTDLVTGLLLLALSLLLLCSCLVCMVKILNLLLKGRICKLIRKTLNANLPGKLSHLTGYVAMVTGAAMTILVQSSSVFTSAMTPLVGVGIIKLERMYPLTLGSNIGTTATGLLAAMAASGDKLEAALQIALCHLFFNISGIILFYPIPQTRLPIKLAKIMGNVTAEYRWFAIFYLIVMFFALPLSVFALSMWGAVPLAVIGGTFLFVFFLVIVINIIQSKSPKLLPGWLRNWEFLPECLHSLDPLDRLLRRVVRVFRKCFPCCCKRKKSKSPLSSVSISIIDHSSDDSYMQELKEILPNKDSFNIEALKDPLEKLAQQSKDTSEAAEQTDIADISLTDSGYCTQVNSTMPSRVNSILHLNNTAL